MGVNARIPTRSGKSTSAIFGTLTLVLLVSAIVMALIVRPPPPPSIAELGPAPQEQIRKARKDQAAGSGKAEPTDFPKEEKAQQKEEIGKNSASSTTTSKPTKSSPGDVPPTHRCYGNPPRQTEDPHSPPCAFEIFRGNNGGNTANGVTETEIHIAWTTDDSRSRCGYSQPTFNSGAAILEHLNRNYEFYGRRLVFKGIDGPCPHIKTTSPSEANAMANEIVSSKPFASIFEAPQSFNDEFHRKLAKAEIHSINYMQAEYSSNKVVDGWTWLLKHPGDVAWQLGGDFVCRAFAGRNARHAGQEIRNKIRKFAIVAYGEQGIYPETAPLTQKIKACGAEVEVFEFSAKRNNSAEMNQIIVQLKENNFTTIITVTGGEGEAFYGLAEKHRFFPEWFFFDITFSHSEVMWSGHRETAPHARHAFGFTTDARLQPQAQTPAYWAMEEGGETGGAMHVVEPLYKNLVVLASGVQEAGPILTAKSFRQALWETVWPNPSPGRPPYWQQRVSFGPGDPVFYDDFAIWWWNENAPSQRNVDPFDDVGSFCYIERGGRFSSASFPGDSDRRLFDTDREPC